MPKMTSTSSSSNDRITDCAPVSCCGATFLGWLDGPGPATFAADCAALASTKSPYGGVADRAGGRVVGALTVSSFVFDVVWTLKSLPGQQKTPVSVAAVRGLRVDTCDYARVGASAVSTRNPITTSKPSFCTTDDRSLRTGQPSNSLLPAAQCNDGGVTSQPPSVPGE